MPITSWTISTVGSGANGTELVGCHIKINGNCYQFLSPSNVLLASACGQTSLPTLPCQFPMFNSALAGSTAVNWYITLESVTDGPSQNKAKGNWGNSGYKTELTGIETDGWTAQANQVDDVEAEKHKAVASASPKP